MLTTNQTTTESSQPANTSTTEAVVPIFLVNTTVLASVTSVRIPPVTTGHVLAEEEKVNITVEFVPLWNHLDVRQVTKLPRPVTRRRGSTPKRPRYTFGWVGPTKKPIVVATMREIKELERKARAERLQNIEVVVTKRSTATTPPTSPQPKHSTVGRREQVVAPAVAEMQIQGT